jgi:hypothetical protein
MALRRVSQNLVKTQVRAASQSTDLKEIVASQLPGKVEEINPQSSWR